MATPDVIVDMTFETNIGLLRVVASDDRRVTYEWSEPPDGHPSPSVHSLRRSFCDNCEHLRSAKRKTRAGCQTTRWCAAEHPDMDGAYYDGADADWHDILNSGECPLDLFPVQAD